MTIGEKIKKARQLNKWTQAQLATIVDLPVSRIQQYEANIRNPKETQLITFANALGVSTEYFTDFSLETCHSIMFALFELEDTFKLQLEKVGDRYTFSFDDYVLRSYIAEWGKEREKSKLSQETLEKYNEWKMKFPEGIIVETTEKLDNIRKKNQE